MIRAVSLMPAPIVLRRKRDARVRAWAAVCIAAGALGLLIAAGTRQLLAGPGAVSAAQLQSAESSLNELVQQREKMRGEAVAAAATLAAVRAAADHPDWSLLLAFLSDACGDRVTLSEFTLEPADDDTGFDITIAGSGRTQQDVARFILTLERSGVFSSTRLVGTGASNGRVTFNTTCAIRTARPAAPPKPAGSGSTDNTESEGGTDG